MANESCSNCGNQLLPGQRRRWNWHELVFPGVTVVIAIGSWIWFLSSQVASVAQAQERLTVVERAQSEQARQFVDISTRLSRMEPMLEFLVTRQQTKN